MTTSLCYAARSSVGLVRSSNQDSGYAGPHLMVLCDGMGGPAGGDIASAVAVDHLVPLDADSHQAGDLLGLLRDAVQAGSTATVAAEVCTLPLDSVVGTLCTLCTPLSYLSLENAPFPFMSTTASLMPLSPVSFNSMISVFSD